jgi:hypothetical protein
LKHGEEASSHDGSLEINIWLDHLNMQAVFCMLWEREREMARKTGFLFILQARLGFKTEQPASGCKQPSNGKAVPRQRGEWDHRRRG